MGREEKEKKEKGGYGERLREITAVLKKHAITRGVSPEKLRLILEDLGPTYIKLGQIMSLRSDILPKIYCDELMKLCSDVPSMPFSQVIEVLEESMGCPWQEEFQRIDAEAPWSCIHCTGAPGNSENRGRGCDQGSAKRNL